MGNRARRRSCYSLVVAFASRELMAPDPGDRKVCSSHSSSADQNFAVI
jgi:hypothetical protein